MLELEFQTWKMIAVATAFGLSVYLQCHFPRENQPQEVLRNWRLNLPLALLNSLVLGLICTGCTCSVSLLAQKNGFGLCNMFDLGQRAPVIVALLTLDLTACIWHMANHRIPFLWRFHSVHHSDTVFETSTAVRFHIGELLISLVVRLLAVAILGLPIVGILAFEMIYAFFNFFEHGNIKLSPRCSRILALLFITPEMHRFHHSANAAHLNTNFGTILTIWDRWFRTFAPGSPGQWYRVGLPEPATWAFSFFGVLRHPFGR